MKNNAIPSQEENTISNLNTINLSKGKEKNNKSIFENNIWW